MGAALSMTSSRGFLARALSLLLLLSGCFTPKQALARHTTTVWVVRHAEKTQDDPQDPRLSEEGTARATALAERLKEAGVEVILSTRYRRSRATAEPLARVLGKSVLIYEPQDFEGLKNRVLREFKGKRVLVVGHSNTVLEIIEALGGRRPVKALSDADYDFIFKVTIPGRGDVAVESGRYGAQRESQGG